MVGALIKDLRALCRAVKQHSSGPEIRRMNRVAPHLADDFEPGRFRVEGKTLQSHHT